MTPTDWLLCGVLLTAAPLTYILSRILYRMTQLCLVGVHAAAVVEALYALQSP